MASLSSLSTLDIICLRGKDEKWVKRKGFIADRLGIPWLVAGDFLEHRTRKEGNYYV